MLVIIAVTLNVNEINQSDFYKVNGCREKKATKKKKKLSFYNVLYA